MRFDIIFGRKAVPLKPADAKHCTCTVYYIMDNFHHAAQHLDLAVNRATEANCRARFGFMFHKPDDIYYNRKLAAYPGLMRVYMETLGPHIVFCSSFDAVCMRQPGEPFEANRLWKAPNPDPAQELASIRLEMRRDAANLPAWKDCRELADLL